MRDTRSAAAGRRRYNSREDEVSGWILPFLRKGLARGIGCLSLEGKSYFEGILDTGYGSDVP